MTEVFATWSVHFCLGSCVSTAIPMTQSSRRNTGKTLDRHVHEQLARGPPGSEVEDHGVGEQDQAGHRPYQQVLHADDVEEEPQGQVDHDEIEQDRHEPLQPVLLERFVLTQVVEPRDHSRPSLALVGCRMPPRGCHSDRPSLIMSSAGCFSSSWRKSYLRGPIINHPSVPLPPW